MIFAEEPYLLHLLAGSETITALEAANALLESRKHNANEREPTDHLTPLHVAAAWGNIAMCQLLIHYGAAVDARDIDKRRPVDVAADGECKRFFKRLRKRPKKQRRSKFGRFFRSLFRCAHSPNAVNQSAMFVATDKLAKKRNSCPAAGLAIAAPKQKIRVILAENPPPIPSTSHPSKPRHSTSLAREAFMAEENSGGTSVKLKEENQPNEYEAGMEALQQQFTNFGIEDVREKVRQRSSAGDRRVSKEKLAQLEEKSHEQLEGPIPIAHYSATLQQTILNGDAQMSMPSLMEMPLMEMPKDGCPNS